MRFLAPYRTFEGRELDEAYYVFTARGPAPCRRPTAYTFNPFLAPGDRAAIIVDRGDALDGRENWCPGRYRGHIDWERTNSNGDVTRRRRIVSDIRFSVRTRAQLRRTRTRRGHFQFFPRVGGPHETFIARFPASYRASISGLNTSYYNFLARGPKGCRAIDAGFPILGDKSPDVVRGDRVVLDVDSAGIEDGRRSWCRGRYVGRVVYIRESLEEEIIFRRVIRSHIRFTVR